MMCRSMMLRLRIASLYLFRLTLGLFVTFVIYITLGRVHRGVGYIGAVFCS